MARHRRAGRSCKFESLETRNLLAGDVTASIRHGDLIIKGDKLANGIAITAGATAGMVVVTGINAGGSATNVNGTPNGAVTLSGFTGDLKISMKGGDDTVSINGLTVPGKATLKGGKGNDTFTIDGSTFNKLKTSLGRGNDKLDISDTTVSVKTRLNGGHGTNTLTNGTDNSLTDLKVKNFVGASDGSSTTPSETSPTSPTLAISGAASVNEGSLYTLSLISSGTGANSISQWTVTWGDGSAAQVVSGNPSSVTHIYTDGAATRTISAAATNPSGTFNAGNTVSVAVGNVAPTLSISGAASVSEGSLYILNLSSADAGADTISQWAINWGDGSAVQTVTGNPSTATHTFADGPATRTISATATDEDGTFSAGNTVTVTVNNVAPAAAISGASSVNEGSLYTLNLSSSDPGADTISQWVINWGDGSPAQTVTGNPSSIAHTFTDGPATRTISATATDEDGTVNATGTVSVTVVNVVPTLLINGATSIQEGALYTLHLSSTDPGADTITQWTINWGDNTPSQVVTGNPTSVTHTFADGVRLCTIIATATDEDSTFAATNTFAVIVDNATPTLAISGASSVDEGSLYTLHLSSSDQGADTISRWNINWGDGTPIQVVVGNPTSVTHTFADGLETRTISATATDEDGTFDAGNTVIVTVNNISPTLAISGAASIDEGSLYILNLSSSDPGTDTISYWTIQWGDGSPDDIVTGNPSTASHSYADGIADVVISATATDEDGTFAAGNTVSVAIQNVAPLVALMGSTSVDEGTFNFWQIGPTFDPGADQVTEYIVHWGDGSTETIQASQLSAYGHRYAEGPNAYTITVDLVDEDGTYLSAATLDVTVNNVVPSVSLYYPPVGVFEGYLSQFSGTYADSGLSDSRTLTVEWGDPNDGAPSTFQIPAIQDLTGTPTLNVGDTFNSTTDGTVLTINSIDAFYGTVSFYLDHLYLDDGPAPGNGLNADNTQLTFTVTDNNGDSGSIEQDLAVFNLPPSLYLDAPAPISENDTATLTGTLADMGLLDVHTLTINWGDVNNIVGAAFMLPAMQDAAGNVNFSVGDTFNSGTDNSVLTITLVDVATGKIGFSLHHQYLDEGLTPASYPYLNYAAVYGFVIDDDQQGNDYSTYIEIHNAPPVVSLDSVADISENGIITLTGSFTDSGLLDGHVVIPTWGDTNDSGYYYFDLPAIQDASGAPTLNVGDTFTSPYVNDVFNVGRVLTVTSINAVTGQVGFSIQHQYPDDGPEFGNGTASDENQITVYVHDSDDQYGSASTTVTVNNLAPTISLDPVAAGIQEGGYATLTGTFTDTGTLDSHTLSVNWGDPGNAEETSIVVPSILNNFGSQNLAVGNTYYYNGYYYGYNTTVLTITSVDVDTRTVAFSIQRRYLDDGAVPGNGTDNDLVTIAVTIADDDGGTANDRRFATVYDVAPTVSLDAVPGISEDGIATLTGSFSDPSFLDAHTLTVNWSDPNNSNPSTFTLPAILGGGGYYTLGPYSFFYSSTDSAYLVVTSVDTSSGLVNFQVQHQYFDDGPSPGNGTGSDISAINVKVTDDDGLSGSSTRFLTVSNREPVLEFFPVPDIFVGGTATLTADYYGSGTRDSHTLSIQWGDLSAGSTFAIPALVDSAGNAAFGVGSTFNSTSDGAVLTVTEINTAFEGVVFSVGHQYVVTRTKEIDFSVTDDDGGQDTASTTVTVKPIVV